MASSSPTCDLRRFVSGSPRAYNVVLEKSWLLSGYLSTLERVGRQMLNAMASWYWKRVAHFI
jgi:hypothetical protein